MELLTLPICSCSRMAAVCNDRFWLWSVRKVKRGQVCASVTGSTLVLGTSTAPLSSPHCQKCPIFTAVISEMATFSECAFRNGLSHMSFRHHSLSPPPPVPCHTLHNEAESTWKQFEHQIFMLIGDLAAKSTVNVSWTIGSGDNWLRANGQLATRDHVMQTSPARPASPQGHGQSLQKQLAPERQMVVKWRLIITHPGDRWLFFLTKSFCCFILV